MDENELFSTGGEKPIKKDIGKILSLYLQKWRLFLVGVALSLLICLLYLTYIGIPTYKISSTMLIKEGYSVPNMTSVATFGTSMPTDPLNDILNITSRLKSKTLMERVVNDLSLSTTYNYNDGIKEVEIYGKEVPIKVIVNKIDSTILNEPLTVKLSSGSSFTLTDHMGETSTAKFGQQIHKPYGIFTIVATKDNANNDEAKEITFYFKDMSEVVNTYTEALSVLPLADKASVLVVSLLDPIPDKGKDIINTLLKRYTDEALEDKKRSVNNTILFLDDRLKYITGLMTGVEQKVEQYKRSNELTDVSTQASEYLAQANASNNSLSEWAIQIDILESLENYLNQNPGEYQLVPSTLGIEDQTLVSLITKFNELELERERLLRTVNANSPLLQNINEQLANLRVNILENLRNIKSSLTIKSNSYKSNNEKFKSKISKVPSMERDLLEISRQQSIKQNIYEYLLQKREESTLAKAAIVSNSEIIDPASSTSFPVSPNIPTLLLIAIVAGIGIPFVYIYLTNSINGKVYMREDIQEIANVPILGEIPHSDFEIVTREVPDQGSLVEVFRIIRAKILYTLSAQENKVLLVTSSTTGEGKTFFSTNLAASLTSANKKVVLIELDIRNPTLASLLELPYESGVLEYLTSDKVSIVDIIQYSNKIPDLSIICAGGTSFDSAELLMSSKLSYLITILKERFDYIIVDTSSIGQVADAMYLNSFIDAVVYLARYNYTTKSQLAILGDVYNNKSLKNISVVFNDLKVSDKSKKIYTRDNKKPKIKKQIS